MIAIHMTLRKTIATGRFNNDMNDNYVKEDNIMPLGVCIKQRTVFVFSVDKQWVDLSHQNCCSFQTIVVPHGYGKNKVR